MKNTLIFIFLITTLGAFTQVKNIQVKNLVVIGQFDKYEDRFTIESALTNLLNDYGIKTTPSVNYVKSGESSTILAGDSLQQLLAAKGFDTYVVVSVRGYDRKYKLSELKYPFNEKLDQGTLREIYRNAAVSVTFEFAFYRNGEFLGYDQVKCNNISDRESTIKKFVKKTEKKVLKNWR